jgi:hypothetical protein
MEIILYMEALEGESSIDMGFTIAMFDSRRVISMV